MDAQLLRFLLISASVFMSAVAGADDPSDQACSELAPLPDDERQQITLNLLEQHPELASSPGVKSAHALPPGCPVDKEGTVVIFYPHTDNHGIKEAFQALCVRTHPSRTWACDHVSFRRYLRLASQDFEVVIRRGEITSEAALALIEATRRDLQAGVTSVSDLPDIATVIWPHRDISDPDISGYRVGWRTPDGRSRLTMLAKLTEGGDPTNPDDWHSSLLKPSVQE